MSNNSWNDIGEKIRDTVQDAIDSRDFKQLNETINQVVNTTFKNVKDGVAEVANSVANDAKRRSYKPPYKDSVTTIPDTNHSVLYAKRPSGLISGGVATSIGFSLMGIFFVLALSFLGIGMTGSGGVKLGFIIGSGFMAAFGSVGLVVGLKGQGLLKRVKRFRRYVELLGSHEYYKLQDLAAKTGRSNGYVLKDLREMIRRGMFLNGRIDDQETHLITSNEAYEQYQIMQKAYQERKVLDQRAMDINISEECREIIVEGKSYIAHVRKCNDDIPDLEFSGKLARLEEIIKRIFIEVGKNPKNAPELHKFMNYYLPTTTKLIDAYRDIAQQPIQGENIQNTKHEIEDTLDTINDAFEKLLDRFFQDTAWDISSDISVMKTMLQQEGLTESELTISK